MMSTLASRAAQRTAAVARSRVAPSTRSNTTNLFPIETWPLLVAIAGGCGLCAFANLRFACFSPDLKWNRAARQDIQHEGHADAYGLNWGSHQRSCPKMLAPASITAKLSLR